MQDKTQILIVDDEEQMLRAMDAVLVRGGYNTITCSNGNDALRAIGESKVDLVISDMRMPEMMGSELLAKLKEVQPKLPVVMITAYGTISEAVNAMKNGAFDFLTKPFSAEDLEQVVERALRPVKRLSPRTPTSDRGAPTLAIITCDPAFTKLIEIAVTIAQSNASVLLQGESGTGKELLARLIHSSSTRAEGPFVAVNCAALPDNLLESELFGHEKGSFTGAVGTKVGKFELANGGTILLDEISEMEATLQAKLLRVLQEREVDRVGGQRPIPIDVRVIATTNRDIKQCVADGTFREDLYYRLNVIPLFVPRLADRKGDVRLLVEHFVKRYAQHSRKHVSKELFEALERYPWPGNIRELQNACERAVLLSPGEELKLEHFMLGEQSPSSDSKSSEGLRLQAGLSVAEAERRLIMETLRTTGNNKTKAAELLGISIRTLRNKLHEYGYYESESAEAVRED